MIQSSIQDDDETIARASFAQNVSALIKSVQDAKTDLLEATQSIHGTLGAIDGLRKAAKVAFARALYLNSYSSEKQATYTHSLGTLAVAEQLRYKQALKNAQLMADMAKRAIEQRIGMRLSDMRDDLPLVGAPSTWEGTVCSPSFTGIDEAVVTGLGNDDPSGMVKGFIGDYVIKLENLVESYRIRYPFHEGVDSAVISLRDDVKGVQTTCRVPSRNLFKQAGQLDNSAWVAAGCKTVTVSTSDGDIQTDVNDCAAAMPLAVGTESPTPISHSNTKEGIVGYQVHFAETPHFPGAPPNPLPTDVQFCNSSSTCGWQPGAALAQRVSLTPGRYRLSWYTKDQTDADPLPPGMHINAEGAGSAAVVQIVSTNGSRIAPTTFGMGGSTVSLYTIAGSTGWTRLIVEFDIVTPGDYTVGFGGPTSGGIPGTTESPRTITVAAPMLEPSYAGQDENDPTRNREVPVSTFQNTDANLTTELSTCQDTDGAKFRLQSWHRNCQFLCDDGFSGNCSQGTSHCYREMTFTVDQSGIQGGRMFNYSGFARGNFNYRIESLGLNFVGDVRDCADSTAPETCYNAAFVPYSIEHNGPFYVLNQLGNEYRAFLEEGRIEHARGLAAERYISNPMSSTDRELMSGYLRNEFRGRPLDGQFVVRVWEEPGVYFDAIKDVQLVLNYRYWTRFD